MVLRCMHLRDFAAESISAGQCMASLRFSREDEVSLLNRGFPDQSGEVAWFARACRVTTVAALVKALHYCHPVQCLCMDMCLAKDVYRRGM